MGDNSVYIADAFYQALSDEQKKIVDDGVMMMCEMVTDIVLDQESTAIAELEGYGITVYQPDMTKMREEVISWYYDNPEVMSEWDLDILDQIMALG